MSIDVRPIAIKIISYRKAFCKYRIFWDSFNLQNPWKVFCRNVILKFAVLWRHRRYVCLYVWPPLCSKSLKWWKIHTRSIGLIYPRRKTLFASASFTQGTNLLPKIGSDTDIVCSWKKLVIEHRKNTINGYSFFCKF